MKTMMNSNSPSHAVLQFCSGMPDDETREHLIKNPRYWFNEAVRKNDAATCFICSSEYFEVEGRGIVRKNLFSRRILWGNSGRRRHG